jgi:hypothetical protein
MSMLSGLNNRSGLSYTMKPNVNNHNNNTGF